MPRAAREAPWGAIPAIAQAARAFRDGSLSPSRLLEMCLARIAEFDASVHAFLVLDEERARDAAARATAELARGQDRGPLHGIPVGVKDLIDVAGLRTTAQSRVRIDSAPAYRHAPAWASLEAAGAVMLGKLALHEFALGGSLHDLPWPPARNPWDLSLGINGSSSGCAAAVAAGFVLGALGTDTGGSIRAPALCCGIAGMKPARGVVSGEGIVPLSPVLDVAGPLARTAEDCALLYAALAGAPAWCPSHDISGLRVGVPRRWVAHECAPVPAIAAAFERAVDKLAASGARVIDIELPPMREFVSALTIIMLKQAWNYHAKGLVRRYGDYGQVARCRIMAGGLVDEADYRAALRLQEVLTRETDAALREVDVAITPAGTALASPIASATPPHALLAPSYTRAFSLTGHACLVAPVEGTADPMPIGVQAVCCAGSEDKMFAVGKRVGLTTQELAAARRPMP
jgi:aspartyl-tRNA(Asn)/glutamyl-tRNA(Gln) amidotransferase subunit A